MSRYAVLLLLVAALPAAAAQFLWLSDIHFDPLADPALADKLATAEPAQWAAILASGTANFPAFGHDTSWPLFSSVLQASKETLPNAAFIMVTGDLLVHHFREHFNAAATIHDDDAFRSFVRKSVEFVGLQLKERSARAPVIVALGNNDDECGDYAIQPNGPFLQDTAKLVSDLAGVASSGPYASYGSYSVPSPAVKKQRIIVLDTVFFSPKHHDSCGHGADDAGEKLLEWLASSLEEARSRHEKVWLVYHIPPGLDAYATNHTGQLTPLWKDSYTSKFIGLLNQYAEIVGPNFAGHVHVDDFRLLRGSSKRSPFVLLAPPVSPITGQNPTFRVVTFDAHGNLKDQSTYYLTNLLEAGSGALPKWELEYSFRTAWRLNGLNAANYSKLFERIGDSTEEAQRWTIFYSTSNPHGSSITPANFRQFYCASGKLKAEEYQACITPGT